MINASVDQQSFHCHGSSDLLSDKTTYAEPVFQLLVLVSNVHIVCPCCRATTCCLST